MLPEFDSAATLLDHEDQQTENGCGRLSDGGLRVSVRTDMPGVTPAMWEWWFGWHGSDARRYKLWHRGRTCRHSGPTVVPTVGTSAARRW